ncbi:MAG: four helix bundle protein [Crocinitomicaceae bacterium]
MERKNEILDQTYAFALKIVAFCNKLDESRKFAISNQLIRSGTSVGANVRESQSSHSKADFAAKMVIAAKEADESEYWLMICKDSEGYPDPMELLEDIKSIKRILFKIIASSKR